MLRGEDVRVAMFGCQTWGHRTPHAFLDPAHDRATAVTDPRGKRAREETRSEPVTTRARTEDGAAPAATQQFVPTGDQLAGRS
ncbi:hypothetical protein OH769_30780 [[Kitasatospora] papulosa]|uniref:hypothetical protein n=1 Tax=Streptomyces TaxID=1883 RepID=UPI00117E4EB7|nr:hypothetical protein [[Kitasatospora] papulosa]WSK32004.1 hypothetical protein OG483_30675 [[Kitasatospora] papulosa]